MIIRKKIEKMLREATTEGYAVDGYGLIVYIFSGGELDTPLLAPVLAKNRFASAIAGYKDFSNNHKKVLPSTQPAKLLAMAEAGHYTDRMYCAIYNQRICRFFKEAHPDAREILWERLMKRDLLLDDLLLDLFAERLTPEECLRVAPYTSNCFRYLASKTGCDDETLLDWVSTLSEVDDDVLGLFPRHLFAEAMGLLLKTVSDKKTLCERILRSVKCTPEAQAMVLNKIAGYAKIDHIRVRRPLDLSGMAGVKLCRLISLAYLYISPRWRIQLPKSEEDFKSKVLEVAMTNKVLYKQALENYKLILEEKSSPISDVDRLIGLVESIDSANPTEPLLERARKLNSDAVWAAIPALVQVSEAVRENSADKYVDENKRLPMPADRLIDTLNKMGLPTAES